MQVSHMKFTKSDVEVKASEFVAEISTPMRRLQKLKSV